MSMSNLRLLDASISSKRPLECGHDDAGPAEDKETKYHVLDPVVGKQHRHQTRSVCG
jgi:hypothetical protein